MAKSKSRRNKSTGKQVATRAIGDASYSQQMLAGASVGGALTFTGNRMSLGDAYSQDKADRDATYARCVNVIQGPASALKGEVYDPRTGETVEHPVARLFNEDANPEMSGHTLTAWLVAKLCSPQGQGFAYLDMPRLDAGDLTVGAIYPHVDYCEPVAGTPTRNRPSGGPVAFKAKVGSDWWMYAPEETLWVRHSSHTNPWTARNPLLPAENSIALSYAAQQYLLNGLTEGVSVGGILHLGEAPTKEAAQDAAYQAHRKMTGPANSKRLVYTNGPTKPEWIPFGMSPVDLALIDVLNISREQIIMALGVPRDLALSESKYENRPQAMTELWENAIIPLLRIIEAEVTRRLLANTGLAFRYDLSEVEALADNRAAKAAVAQTLAQTNAVLVDEVREHLDLEPLPNGLGQVIPAQMLAQGLNPTAPTEDLVRSILSSTDQDTATALLSGLLARTQETPAPLAIPAAERLDQRADDEFDANAVVKVYETLETRGRKAVQELAAEQLEDVLNRLERTRKKGDDLALRTLFDGIEYDPVTAERIGLTSLFDATKWADRSKRILRPFMERVWGKGQAAMAVTLKVEDDASVYDEQVEIAMAKRLDDLVDQVNTTTAKAISEAILKPGVEEGDSIDALADRLKARFEDMDTNRAKMIARSETVGGYNAAQQTIARAHGVTVGRTWHAKIDNRTRDSHVALHGHTLNDMDSPFPNGLMFPGDPSGKASESIQCRCVLQYVV